MRRRVALRELVGGIEHVQRQYGISTMRTGVTRMRWIRTEMGNMLLTCRYLGG